MNLRNEIPVSKIKMGRVAHFSQLMPVQVEQDYSHMVSLIPGKLKVMQILTTVPEDNGAKGGAYYQGNPLMKREQMYTLQRGTLSSML